MLQAMTFYNTGGRVMLGFPNQVAHSKKNKVIVLLLKEKYCPTVTIRKQKYGPCSGANFVTLFIREFELKYVLEQKLMRIASGATWF